MRYGFENLKSGKILVISFLACTGLLEWGCSKNETIDTNYESRSNVVIFDVVEEQIDTDSAVIEGRQTPITRVSIPEAMSPSVFGFQQAFDATFLKRYLGVRFSIRCERIPSTFQIGIMPKARDVSINYIYMARDLVRQTSPGWMEVKIPFSDFFASDSRLENPANAIQLNRLKSVNLFVVRLKMDGDATSFEAGPFVFYGRHHLFSFFSMTGKSEEMDI